MSIKKIKDMTDEERPRNAGTESPDDEIVTTEFEGCTIHWRTDEICDEFFGGVRVSDEMIQDYAETLAANLEIVEDFDGEIATIDESNFNDSFHDMMADLREDFVKKLVKREKALYAIAHSCFEELCGGLPADVIKKRLDDAIENTIKEQA
jgi:hypothetical protein